MPNRTKNEQIDAYLSGDMSSEDRLAFEHDLRQDDALSKELIIWQRVDEALSDEEALQFTQRLQTTSEQYLAGESTPDTTHIRSLWPRMASAAAVALLLAATAIWLLWPQPPPAELYAAYYEPYAISDNFRGLDGTYPEPVAEAMKAYGNGDYQTAKTLLGPWRSDVTFGPMATFYYAHCMMGLGKWNEAILLFQQLASRTNHVFVFASQWYLALAYLKTEQLSAAKNILQQLAATPRGLYSLQAEALLKEIQ